MFVFGSRSTVDLEPDPNQKMKKEIRAERVCNETRKANL